MTRSTLSPKDTYNYHSALKDGYSIADCSLYFTEYLANELGVKLGSPEFYEMGKKWVNELWNNDHNDISARIDNFLESYETDRDTPQSWTNKK